MKAKRVLIVLGFASLYVLGSVAGAMGRGGFCDKTAEELKFVYKNTWGDDSFRERRELKVYLETSMQSCTMTCYYDDNIKTDYDAVAIVNCDVAPGFLTSGLVWNSEGASSAYTANTKAGQTSNKKKVEHTGIATRWRLFIGEDK
ncbi:MAG: hypothetical protein Q4C48_00340 [Lachnospiraceae bacterium]|nr:hypothetical protein [Lachnospiraceae bacterium]